MERKIKVGDWGWFWDEKPSEAIFGELSEIYRGLLSYMVNNKTRFAHFAYDHPTGKFKVMTQDEYDEKKINLTYDPCDVMKKKFAEAGAKADPYAELKKAHTEGKIIQLKHNTSNNEWVDCDLVLWMWPPEDYRIKPETKYVPYKFSDTVEFMSIPACMGCNASSILRATLEGVFIHSSVFVTYANLLSRFEKPDGTPFGKLVD